MVIRGMKRKSRSRGPEEEEEKEEEEEEEEEKEEKIGLLVRLSLLHVKVMLYVSFGGAKRIKIESYSNLFRKGMIFYTD